jgi:hypothetical protein
MMQITYDGHAGIPITQILIQIIAQRGQTALMRAVRGGLEASIRLLLEAGADPTLTDKVNGLMICLLPVVYNV